MQSLPNYNYSDTKSVNGSFNIFAEYLLNLIQHCMPAVVKSYDRATNTAIVTPAVNVATTTGEYVSRDVIKTTVLCFGGGGFFMNFPLQEGDKGWLIAADMDTSLFKQDLAVADPNTNLKHQYPFGFFLPDLIRSFTVSEDDAGRLVIQNTSGSEKISIGTGDTKVTSANLTITAANVNITGEVAITGNVNIDGTMHSTNYDAHTHTSAAEGSPTSTPSQ